MNIRAVNRCNDYEFENYFDWYTIAYAITATSLPALSLPCGFTADGLPVGLQVIGPPRGEASLLSAAQSIEDLFNIAKAGSHRSTLASKLVADPIMKDRNNNILFIVFINNKYWI